MNSVGYKILKISFGKGKHRIYSVAIITADGVIVDLAGGDKPHVGAVSINIPRRSLKDPSKFSASSSVFTLVGHKDDEIAKPISEKLSRELNQVVVVVAGLHVEHATNEDINRLLSNSMHIAEILVKKLKLIIKTSSNDHRILI